MGAIPSGVMPHARHTRKTSRKCENGLDDDDDDGEAQKGRRRRTKHRELGHIKQVLSANFDMDDKKLPLCKHFCFQGDPENML